MVARKTNKNKKIGCGCTIHHFDVFLLFGSLILGFMVYRIYRVDDRNPQMATRQRPVAYDYSLNEHYVGTMEPTQPPLSSSWWNEQQMTVVPTLTPMTSIPILPTIPPTSTAEKEEQERLIDQDILFYQTKIQEEERQKIAREAAVQHIKKQQEKNILCNIRNGQVRCIPFKRNQYFH